MTEFDCTSCVGACCKGPRVLSLTAGEHDQMQEAGTELLTVLEPVDYDRPDAPYPVRGLGFDPRRPDTILKKVEKQGFTEPLAAGLGRYIMVGTCGNLQEVLGRELCGIYHERPQVCREFEMGSLTCRLMRQEMGVGVPVVQISEREKSDFRWPRGH